MGLPIGANSIVSWLMPDAVSLDRVMFNDFRYPQ